MIIYYLIFILFCYLCILLDKKEICNAEYYCDRKWCDPPSDPKEVKLLLVDPKVVELLWGETGQEKVYW